VQATTTRPKITATADGVGVVSHAGSRLLADVADRTTLTAELSEAVVGLRKPRARHDPDRVLVDIRPGRGPDPLREGHRAGPLPIAAVRHQRRLARRGHVGGRPDRLDPTPAPARSPRQGGTEDAALPPAPCRRPPHPWTTPVLVAHPTHLALGTRPCGSVHPTDRTARPGWLTFNPDTASGGSHRQKERAGHLAMPAYRIPLTGR
jgi:hypothetical protein